MTTILPLPAGGLALPYMGDVMQELQTKKRSDIMSALVGLDKGNAKDRAQSAALLRRLLASLSSKGQIAMRLQLARAVAGLNSAGRRLAGANAAYRGQLNVALQKATSLDDKDREASLAYAVALWRLAEGKAVQWNKPPFHLGPYAATTTAKAVIERAATEDMNSGHPELALRKYKALAATLEGQPLRSAFDLRILEISRVLANKSNQPRIYEAALVAAYKAYLDPGILGSGHENAAKITAAEISHRHQAFVTTALTQAARSTASNAERRAAVAAAQTFLTTLSDSATIEAVKIRIANVYVVNHQYAEAVGLYKELAETKDQARSRTFVVLAVRCQSKLAAWPEQAPWRGMDSTHGAEREELLSLYTKLEATSGATSQWFTSAQRGLLAINQGRQSEAFDLWQALLRKDAGTSHAANAAGMMLTSYMHDHLWADAEKLARFCLASHVRPMSLGKPLAAGDLLALALLEAGKEAMAASNFDVAVKKLAEVVSGYESFSKHDEAYFLLGSAYHGARRHVDAIKTLQAFVARYPRSAYYRQALLNGGDWATPMAFEDHVMAFYQPFVNQFGKDPEAQRVRSALTSLYVGRGRYGDALAVLHATASLAPDPAFKGQALTMTMDLEERHGSPQHAVSAATAVISSSDTSGDAKAAAFAVKARLAAVAGRYGEVQQIATVLSGGETPAVQEALGEARFLLAEGKAKSAVRQDYNLSLNDPTATLKARYATYQNVRQAYQSVCQAGATSFCAGAMVKLGQLSVAFARAADDISIQDTLAKEVVQRFNKLKQDMMNDVARTSQQAEQTALASTEAGHTDPNTTEAVMWQTNSEINLDHVSGETGQGYVQWSTP